jgi:hypothetical protein
VVSDRLTISFHAGILDFESGLLGQSMDMMTLYGGARAALIFLEGDYLERHAEYLRDFLG